jgi:hypothetical protein
MNGFVKKDLAGKPIVSWPISGTGYVVRMLLRRREHGRSTDYRRVVGRGSTQRNALLATGTP